MRGGSVCRKITDCSPVTAVCHDSHEVSAKLLPRTNQRHLPVKVFGRAPAGFLATVPEQRGVKVNRFV